MTENVDMQKIPYKMLNGDMCKSTYIISAHMEECKSARRSGPFQILAIHTSHGRNINKGSKDQTGISTVGPDKASKYNGKTRPSFFPQRLSSINHLSCQ